MALESSFLNLVRGNRLSQLMGLVMSEGREFKYASDYCYVEIPLEAIMQEDLPTEKGMHNQHLYIKPACTLNVHGNYRVLVEPNPALAQYGSVQGSYYAHPEAGPTVPGFYISLRRDLPADEISYAVRLYLRA